MMKMQNRPILSPAAYHGQGLAEYTVIGVLAALVAVAGISVMGGNLDGLLKGLKGDLASHGAKASEMAMLRKQAPVGPVVPVDVPAAPAPSPVADMSIKTPDGQVSVPFTLSQPDQVADSVATTGANGTTKVLSDQISQIAEQQKAAGLLTPDQYQALITLASKGHRLAVLEGLIEDAAKSATSRSDLMETRVQFEGRSMTIEDVWAQIGFDAEGYGTPDIPTELVRNMDGYPAVDDLLDAYWEAEELGALGNPEMASLITGLTTRILQINSAVDITLYDYSGRGDMQEAMAEELNHAYSADICDSGGGKDSGKECKG